MTLKRPVINGRTIPPFLYGTAWKEHETERLTTLALQAGFRGIDTANQRRHYHEAAVGNAVKTALTAGLVSRADLFLQTKFTFIDGQDHRLPYDPRADIPAQVGQSFANSLEHLGVSSIDSYVLHGPSRRNGLAQEDWAAWRAMELIYESGGTRLLGVSNVSLEQLEELSTSARHQPHFVQNRCYAARGWDRQIREFCSNNDIIYQGFSLLTANQAALNHPVVHQIAERHSCTTEQVIFRFALEVGMIPLTGTTDSEHMNADLAVLNLSLSESETSAVERIVL